MGRVFDIERALIVEVVKDSEKWTSNQLNLVPINNENINDALWFNTQDEINNFKYFMDNGHLGFYCYKDGVCIFRTFILTNSANTVVGKNFAYRLGENEVFSAWSKTAEEYRGVGVYSFSLNQIIHLLPDKHISAYIASDNIGSIKGTQKTGFEITRKFLLVKILRLKFYFQYKTNNNKSCFKFGIGTIVNK